MRRLPFIFSAAFFSCLLASAQSRKQASPVVESQQPLEAELTAPLVQEKLKAGTPVVARVLYRWKTSTCTVPVGSLLVGEVVSTETDSDHKNASVTLRFNPAECSGRTGATVALRMYALLIPPTPLSERDFANRGGLYTGYASIIPDGTTNVASTISSPGSLHMDWEQSSAFSKGEMNRSVTLGKVIGSKNISLQPDGPQNTFTIQQKGKRVELLAGTVFILTPPDGDDFLKKVKEAITEADTAAHLPATTSVIVTPDKPKESIVHANQAIEEAEVCSKDCSVANTSNEYIKARKEVAGETINLERYGYSHVTHHSVEHFGTTDSVTYLDDTHLLVTFDQHMLRRRRMHPIWPEYERPVRAVMVNPQTHQIEKVVDWKVVGDSQYVWQAHAGQLLLHLGNQLVLVGSDLKPIRSFELSSPLAWLASDPTGSTYAVGLLNEMHNPKLHDILKRALGTDPEESIAVMFLDSNLDPIGTSTQPSRVPPPVLAVGAEIRAVPELNGRWHLEEIKPNLTKRHIATVLSDCDVHTSMPSSDTLFAVGCRHGQNWYRAFHLDGHLILRGTSSSQEIEQAAIGETSEKTFAVRVVETDSPEVYHPEYKQSDVRRELITVYRSDDGKRLFSASSNDVPFTQQSFALSPDNRQVAVLGTSSLRLVPLL